MMLLAVSAGSTPSCARRSETPTANSEAARRLYRLPSLAATQSDLTAAIEEIGRVVSAAAPGLVWSWRLTPRRVECRPPYDRAGGVEVLLPRYVATGSIPDEDWERVIAVAGKVAVRSGLPETEVFGEGPGHHDIRFYNETGTAIRVSSREAAVMSGSTGCRLPEPPQP